MRILGIDPGSRFIGYAVLEVSERNLNCVASGAEDFSKIKDFPTRLRKIYQFGLGLIETFNPQDVAVEGLIYVKSPVALIKLAQARGALVSAFAILGVGRVFEYSPNLVKQASVGHGHATKEGIQRILASSFGISDINSFDESDALAVAICHSINGGQSGSTVGTGFRKKSGGSSLAQAVVHKASMKEQR